MSPHLGSTVQFRSWQAVSWLVRRLPVRVSYGVAFVAGSIGYYCWPRGRRSMHHNYRRVLRGASAAEIRRMSRRSLVNYCKYLADFVRFPFIPLETLAHSVEGDESFSALDRALEHGKGAVVVCMHFGNWDLGAGAAAARGYPVTVVAESFADPRLDRMVTGARERLGMQLIKMDKAGPSLLRCLKQNGLLALLIDRPVPGDGVKVRFFGEEVEVPVGPARLALRSGAMVVPAGFPRVAPNARNVQILSDFAIACQPTGDEARDVQAVTQAIMDVHERFIREHPDQWYMFREMWPRANGAQAAGSGV
ncbi:MAG: lysophospholipid acyltransferase family protein [Tepidiformaceae bacterium]